MLTISSAKTNKVDGTIFHLSLFLCKIFRKTKILLLQKVFAISPGMMSNALKPQCFGGRGRRVGLVYIASGRSARTAQ